MEYTVAWMGVYTETHKDVKQLLQALTEKDPDMRGRAALALLALKDPRALDPLLQTLRDEDASVRWSAAQTLGALKDLRALGPLLDALRDEDVFVRQAAAEAIERIEFGGLL